MVSALATPKALPQERLTPTAFVELLLSTEYNGALCPKKMSVEAMGDGAGLDQPLTAYYVNTSHNSYLVGHQLTSRSSAAMYRRQLLQGVRSLEIDVGNGTHGPVVTHVGTLCTKVPFAEVIADINKSAFETSELPIVLSLQVQCSAKNQRKMAGVMLKVFGDQIELEQDAATKSPNQLRRKVLIKAKGKKEGKEGDSKGSKASRCTSSSKDLASMTSSSTSSTGIERHASKEDISLLGQDELIALVALHGTKRKGFFETTGTLADPADIGAGWSNRIASIPEWFFDSLAEKSELTAIDDAVSSGKSTQSPQQAQAQALQMQQKMQQLCTQRLCRFYPSRWRTDSFNPSPLLPWKVGAQHVALNLQRNDLPARLNAAFFALGGGGGYVLKPSGLRCGRTASDPGGKVEPWPPRPKSMYRTTITLVSLHRLPSRSEVRPDKRALEHEPHHAFEAGLSDAEVKGSGVRSDVTSPSLVVELHSIGGVCYTTPTLEATASTTRRVEKTATVRDNGYNPVFNHTVHCFASEPRETMLQLLVEVDGEGVAYETVVLGALREGHRAIQLRSNAGTLIDGCVAFVHLSHGEEPYIPSSAAELRVLVEEQRQVIRQMTQRLSVSSASADSSSQLASTSASSAMLSRDGESLESKPLLHMYSNTA